MSKQSKNDRAWQAVFDEYKLLEQIEEQGYAYVTALELKEAGQREPRLMAKQDTLSSRPAIFKQHKLSIFPVENGRYVIFRDSDHKSYFSLDTDLDWIPRESYYPTLDLRSFDSYPQHQQFSESQAIDFAFSASLLQHFLQDKQLYLTIRGRLRSGSFSFALPEDGQTINVNGVQIEVDSGYESPECLYLIEAKVGKRDDFHIRQLFYPWLEWSQKTGKSVVPILLLYSNSQYYLLQFQFSSTFGELHIVNSMNYTLNETPSASLNFAELFREIPVGAEPEGIPYPQADDLDKVVDIIERIHADLQSKYDISEYFEFDERQGDYYLNAAAYLGFVERRDEFFELSALGKNFIRSHLRADKTKSIITQLLKRPSFREMLDCLLNHPVNPGLFPQHFSIQDLPHSKIHRIIQRHTELNDTTAARRAHTAKSWIKWVLRNAELA